MDAEQARKLTKENLKGPVIEDLIQDLDAAIKEACESGKLGLDPHRAMGRYPNSEEEKAVKEYYVCKGYTWENHDDPDPGHPCSRAYITLSW